MDTHIFPSFFLLVTLRNGVNGFDPVRSPIPELNYGGVYEEYGGDYSDKREEEHDYMQFGMHKDFLLAKYLPLLPF